MMFFDCLANRKAKREQTIKVEFIDLCIHRLNEIMIDGHLAKYYKKKLETAYNIVLDCISNNEPIQENALHDINLDLGDEVFSRYSEVLNSFGKSEMKK